MSDEILIKVENLSKKFTKDFHRGAKSGIKKAVKGFLSICSEFDSTLQEGEFFALQDVSFVVQRGEAVGLIGKNGAGKSTLLKHLVGVYLPDQGKVTVSGNVEGLIELGAGFHPLLSGRDNVLQRCSMLGLSDEDSKKVVDEVITFSELQSFIDMPVQNYSSGMKARLGFATAVLSKPDILLVDEVLSVGDFEFQQKCLKKINEIKSHAAIIFVSHNMQTMNMFCQKGIVFEKGKIVFSGLITDATNFYINKKTRSPILESISNGLPNNFDFSHVKGYEPHDIYGKQTLPNYPLENFEAWWENEAGLRVDEFNKSDKIICLNLKLSFNKDFDFINSFICVGVPIWSKSVDSIITSFNSDQKNVFINEGGEVNLKLSISNKFNHGDYVAVLAIHDGPRYLLRKILPIIKIIDVDPRSQGFIRVDGSWEQS